MNKEYYKLRIFNEKDLNYFIDLLSNEIYIHLYGDITFNQFDLYDLWIIINKTEKNYGIYYNEKNKKIPINIYVQKEWKLAQEITKEFFINIITTKPHQKINNNVFELKTNKGTFFVDKKKNTITFSLNNNVEGKINNIPLSPEIIETFDLIDKLNNCF